MHVRPLLVFAMQYPIIFQITSFADILNPGRDMLRLSRVKEQAQSLVSRSSKVVGG